MFCALFWCRIRKIYILEVYIYFPCVSTQQRATAPSENAPIISPPHSKHLKTGIYQGSANICEVDPDSDLNRQASAILGNTSLQPTSVRNCFEPERYLFSIAIVDLISISALVRFSLLRMSYYYNLTGIACYVYSVYNF